MYFFLQNGDDPASDSNGGGHVTLPVECREKHGYVLVDLQHIVRNVHSYHLQYLSTAWPT